MVEEPMIWMLAPGMTEEGLGYLPSFLNPLDPRPAREQLSANYPHGDPHWRSEPFAIDSDMVMYYPGDPPLQPLAFTMLRDETIALYPADFVAVIQRDRSFVVGRMT